MSVCATSNDLTACSLQLTLLPSLHLTRQSFRLLHRAIAWLPWWLLRCVWLLPVVTFAAPKAFNVPPQSAASALLEFSKQAEVEVLFAFDDLRSVQLPELQGTFEPEEALNRLIRNSGFYARRSARGKFVVSRTAPPTGSIKGKLLLPDGAPGRDLTVAIADTGLTTTSLPGGEFEFLSVAPGAYHIYVATPGFRPLEIVGVRVDANRSVNVETHTLQPADDLVRLAPQIVEGKFYRHWKVRDVADFQPQRAAGNLDLPRSEDDALPYTIYDRDQIARSGVVNLNDFLQRNVIDGNAAERPPEQDGNKQLYIAGSTAAKLRGYGADETIVLVNGRRLPENLVSVSQDRTPPDVNFIPLNLVERVEVLPVSASALYSGNPVGGVINIVLRPNVNSTEVTATYTNALAGFDAPQSTVSLQHGESLLGGKLQVRLNATLTKTMPATETELGYIQANVVTPAATDVPLYRATPNVRSADGTPLVSSNPAAYTSVAPGANGGGGLNAFTGRFGIRSTGLYDLPVGVANSFNSLDYLYGRRQRGASYFGSATYDIRPWLQLGLDGMYSQSTVNRGFDLFRGDLTLAADSPLNPFGQQVRVSLNETAPLLGESYGEARVDFSSMVVGALVRLPAEWRVSMDAQYGHSVTKFRGLAAADSDAWRTAWQKLVDTGAYNPLRDTQQFGPPEAFYDHTIVYYGARDRFVTLGDYQTLDAALRVTNQSFALPTGSGAISLGGDYRMNRLSKYTDERRFGDGTLVETPTIWAGRTVERISAFGELQAPLVPRTWLPRWIKEIETDVAARYVISGTAQESNLAPTGGLKLDLAGGFSFRGTIATSNRLPSPFLSRKISGPAGDVGSGEVSETEIFDPLRNERYSVSASDALNPNLRPESAVTRTIGLIYQQGRVHRMRLSVDFADTRKSGELTRLEPQTVVNLEALFPARVTRAASDTNVPGRISSLRTGNVNLAWRHSQNWSTSLDYAWTQCFGGRLDVYGRWVYFQKYELQVAPSSAMVDELEQPDGTAVGLLKHRSNFGAGWSNRNFGFGLDGHYFHSRNIPAAEWPTTSHRQINPNWQFDAYLQTDLARWLPWKSSRFGLRGQLRVNNIFDAAPPRYANDASGAGVQPYGDWRRQTYAISLQATF
ncbi:MAG: TonB-dependent receptor plug domain-containing protein [Opitutus sp.]